MFSAFNVILLSLNLIITESPITDVIIALLSPSFISVLGLKDCVHESIFNSA